MQSDISTGDKPSGEHLSVLSYKGEHATIGGIGIIHGLASNDELLLLLTLSLGLSSFFMILLGLTVFTLGVVFGMIIFSILIKLPFSELGQERFVKWFNVTISILTLFYGIYILAGGETLNILPVKTHVMGSALLLVSLFLGIKHSMDADHIVAISSMLLRAPDLKNSITLSISWALGHMLTASIITFILYQFKAAILGEILSNFESIVGVMLITIALLTLAWEFEIISWGRHSHSHTHEDGTTHSHH